MSLQRTQNPTKKDLLHRLTSIREKLSSLRQEEEKINQKLSHEYAQSLCKCLMDAKAIEIDFNVLLGGMLEVIAQAQKDTQRACPELSRRVEAWQKAGLMFCRNGRRGPTSIAEKAIIQREGKDKSRTHISSAGNDKNANTSEQ